MNDIVANVKVPLDSSRLGEGRVFASFIHKGLVNHNYIESFE